MKLVIFLAVMIFLSAWLTNAFKQAVSRHILELNQDVKISYAHKISKSCEFVLKNFPTHNFLIVVVWVIGSTVFYFI